MISRTLQTIAIVGYGSKERIFEKLCENRSTSALLDEILNKFLPSVLNLLSSIPANLSSASTEFFIKCSAIISIESKRLLTLSNKLQSKNEVVVTFKGTKYGAFAGFIATWAISSAIAASELALGLQIGTFYSIIGISLELNNVITAALVGFSFHLITGTALGAVLGAVGIRWKKIRMLNPYKSSLVGIGTGLVIWLVLFLPTTTFIVQPSIQYIVVSEQISRSVINISLMAIVFHMIWGAIFGFIMSSLLRIRVFKIKQHYVDIINIDPKIRLVTICDENGQIMYSRHREGVKNLLSKEESKKSLELAMTSWKIRNDLADKIGRGRYVLAEYERIKRITMPFGDNLLLYVTTEVQADHSNIYDRIRKLESGLKYSN
ncbi:MAG: hypothetical protein WAM14_20855 [Candidatus Nitrosopolaris sp.]